MRTKLTMKSANEKIGKVLVSEDEIKAKIKEMGAAIAVDYEGKSPLMIGVLKGAFIFMADRWTPKNPIDGRYVWLPIQFENNLPVLRWLDNWTLDIFDL